MIRQRNSSRWSRNGISPVCDLGMGMVPSYYTAEAWKSRRGRRQLRGAEQVARQARFVAIWIILDDAAQNSACLWILLLSDQRERVLIKRGGRRLGLRILGGDELIDRIRRRHVFLLSERLADVKLRH